MQTHSVWCLPLHCPEPVRSEVAANNKLLCICLPDRTSCYSSAPIEIRGRKTESERARGERERHPLPTGTHGYHCVLWSLAFQQLMESTCMFLGPPLSPSETLEPLDEVQRWHGFSVSDHPMHLTQKHSVLCLRHFGVFWSLIWTSSIKLLKQQIHKNLSFKNWTTLVTFYVFNSPQKNSTEVVCL